MSSSGSEHALLPWFVNGSLSPEESAAFEKHIAQCDGCSAERAELEAFRDQIRQSGAEILGDHPDPESVTAYALGDPALAGDRLETVRRHLAACPLCAKEAGWVTRGPVPEPVSGPRRRHDDAGRRLAAAAAVLLLAGAAAALWILSFRGGATRTLDARVLDSSVRTGRHETISLPRSAEGFTLLLRVDAAPGELPLRVQVRQGDGRSVFDSAYNRPLLEGMFLVLYCDRRDFPDGTYAARVSAGEGGAPLAEYHFEVTSDPPGGDELLPGSR
ncbi:MAG TPA: zf-HC2 domain-containing protein [Candidatus Polarisedimenticolia bacterium]|nr:zf-HC2 domain-containing protein [Candidatus Polarisedimenticolia bacterium]